MQEESLHRIVDVVMWNIMLALVLGYGDERALGDYTPNLRETNGGKSADSPTGDERSKTKGRRL